MAIFRSQVFTAIRALLVMTVLLGLIYPLAMTGVGQLFFAEKADGSFVNRDNHKVASELIGQSFSDATGVPLPQYFQPRPSAGDYDGMTSGASNQGPNNKDLRKAIEQRRAQAAKLDGVSPADVAPDALTASGSGLDPAISPRYAAEQTPRVARERHLSQRRVWALVKEHSTGRVLGFLGEKTVNVVQLNLALDRDTGQTGEKLEP